MKQILCYGDSNTWGHDPATKNRHPYDIRWPGILAKLLGEEYNVVECGIGGRTTVFDDFYFPYRNGSKGLPYALLEHMPIDILIISLGTNDLKFTDAQGSAKGIASLLRIARHTYSSNPVVPILAEGSKILVISPIRMDPDIHIKRPGAQPAGAYEQSCLFAQEFRPICEQYGADFLDAAALAEPSEVDCIHMDAENHNRLAQAVFHKIRQMEQNTENNTEGDL